MRVTSVIASATILLVAPLMIAGCGSSSDQESGGSDVAESALVAIGDQVDIGAKTRPGSIYSYDDFVRAGWKQHEIYEVDTLPDAIAARYGFFNRKNIEIRQYPSHATALSSGVASAEDAIDRTVHDGSGFASRRVYGGYLVAGNVVMLCERSVDDCIALIEAMSKLPQ